MKYATDMTLTDAQKTNVAGIVFWTTADSNTSGKTPAKLTDDKIMATDFPNCTHGLIVSLNDVSQGTKWQETYTNIASWQNSEAFNPENKNDYNSIASSKDDTDPINYILGYQNTKLLKVYNNQCADNNEVLPVSLLDSFSTDNPAPANTTGWFFPSLKELTLLCGVDSDGVYSDTFGTSTKEAMNSILTSLGTGNANTLADANYWSSSEYADFEFDAFIVDFNLALVHYNVKGYNADYVRAVCAY